MSTQCPSCGGDCGRTAKTGCMYGQMSTERERFEVWCESKYGFCPSRWRDDESEYSLPEFNTALAAWQAARAESAAEIEALRKHVGNLCEIARMPNAEHVADAHNVAVRALRAALAAKEG